MKDFHFDAEFEGIDIALADEDRDVLQAAVKGRINFSFILPIFSSTHHPFPYITEFSHLPCV